MGKLLKVCIKMGILLILHNVCTSGEMVQHLKVGLKKITMVMHSKELLDNRMESNIKYDFYQYINITIL
jgi:hypothetical protein